MADTAKEIVKSNGFSDGMYVFRVLFKWFMI